MHLLDLRRWAVPWANAIVLAGLALTVGAGSSGASEAITFHKEPRPHFRNHSDRPVTVSWCNTIVFANRWEFDTCRGAGEVENSVLGSLSFVQPEEWFGYRLVDTARGRPTGFWGKEGFRHLTVNWQMTRPPTRHRTERRYILVKNAHVIWPGQSLYIFNRDAERAIRSYRIAYHFCDPGISRWFWFLGVWGGNWQIPWNAAGRIRCARLDWAKNDMLRKDARAEARGRLQRQAPSYPVYCRKGGSPWRVCSRD